MLSDLALSDNIVPVAELHGPGPSVPHVNARIAAHRRATPFVTWQPQRLRCSMQQPRGDVGEVGAVVLEQPLIAPLPLLRVRALSEACAE